MKSQRIILLALGMLCLLLLFLPLTSNQISIVDAQVASPPPDPGIRDSSVQIANAQYDFSDEAWEPPNSASIVYPPLQSWPNHEKIEIRGSVWYPPLNGTQSFPIIFLLHGRHDMCESTGKGSTEAVAQVWPCLNGAQRIDSYKGYEDLSKNLASHGYIVVSISANGITEYDQLYTDEGATARAALLQYHIDQWNIWSTNGGFPGNSSLFVNKVNWFKVGLMGHSRGGDGIAKLLYNPQLTQSFPHTFGAALFIAPTHKNGFKITGVPFEVLLSYCDGDVRDLEGIQYFDDGRYDSSNSTARHEVLVMGGNHNYYNTKWTNDDWYWVAGDGRYCSSGSSSRLSKADQLAISQTYANALYRTYIPSDMDASPIPFEYSWNWRFYPYLTGDVAPPTSAANATILVSYHAPNTKRLDINKYSEENNLYTNTLGESVLTNETLTPFTQYLFCGLYTFCINEPSNIAFWGGRANRQPHQSNVGSGNNAQPGMNLIEWNGNNISYPYVRNKIPIPDSIFYKYETLQFRVAVDWSDADNWTRDPQNFQVTVSDGTKSFSASIDYRYSSRPKPLMLPPQPEYLPTALVTPAPSMTPFPVVAPHLVLNTVRLPLSIFAQAGVNTAAIRYVGFRFDSVGRLSGRVEVNDLQLSNQECYIPNGTQHTGFQDMPPASPFDKGAQCLLAHGVITGYPCAGSLPCVCPAKDAYLIPYAEITRGQLAKMAARSANLTVPPIGQAFEDIPPSHPFYTEIQQMYQLTYISGYPCGGPLEPCGSGNKPYFRPGSYVTRGQAAKIISNTAQYTDDPGDPLFDDVPSNNPFFAYIQRVAINHAVNGYVCGTPPAGSCGSGSLPWFLPLAGATRGQLAKILAIVFFPGCPQEGGTTNSFPEEVPIPLATSGVPYPVPTP